MIWSAVTRHRFYRFGDLSPKQGRVQRLGKQLDVPLTFDGDKSPAESADKSAHSKACGRGASPITSICVHLWFQLLFSSIHGFAATEQVRRDDHAGVRGGGRVERVFQSFEALERDARRRLAAQYARRDFGRGDAAVEEIP